MLEITERKESNKMGNIKKIGIALVIFGAFVPSVLYPFATITSSGTAMKVLLATKGSQHEFRLNDLVVVFKKGKWIKEGKYKGHYEGRVSVTYPYLIAFAITIVFVGFSLIALTRKQP